MQLMSLGLYLLNDDGTRQTDKNAKEILSYTNHEITEYAKVYTGLFPHPKRGNVEEGGGLQNLIDPLRIDNFLRKDPFPKVCAAEISPSP
jgi:uncharacterized protein (DUF1800 family)